MNAGIFLCTAGGEKRLHEKDKTPTIQRLLSNQQDMEALSSIQSMTCTKHIHDSTHNTKYKVNISERSLPEVESQASALDFPVAVGVQDVLEGVRDGVLGPLGTVAVLDSRSSRGSPRHTGVLGGPATMSMRWGFSWT